MNSTGRKFQPFWPGIKKNGSLRVDTNNMARTYQSQTEISLDHYIPTSTKALSAQTKIESRQKNLAPLKSRDKNHLSKPHFTFTQESYSNIERASPPKLLNATSIVISSSPGPDILKKNLSPGTNQTFSLISELNSPTRMLISTERDKEANLGKTMRILDHTRKINELADDENKEPSNKRAKFCYKTLLLLGSEEGRYQNEMRILADEVYRHLFCMSDSIKERIQQLLPDFDVITDTNIKIFSMSYFEIVRLLLRTLGTERTAAENRDKLKDDQINVLLQNNKEYQALKDSMKSERENLLFEQKKQYDKSIKELNDTIEKLKRDKDAIYYEFLDTKVSAESLDLSPDVILMREECLEHLKRSSIEKLDLKEKLNQARADIENLKGDYSEIIKNYKNSIVKLQFLKDQNKSMEEQVRSLGVQNAKLSVRAAAGLQNFTPRPSLGAILDYFNIKCENFESSQTRATLIKEVIRQKKFKIDQNTNSTS